MKNVIISTLVLFLSNSIGAQNTSLIEFAFPNENNEIVYKEVVEVDSTINAKRLYLKTKEWAAEKFNSAQDVIQMDDEKMIVIRSFITKGHNTLVSNPKKWFTLKVEFKDGRYRYNLSDIIYEFDINHMGENQHYKEKFDSWLKYSTNKNKRKREEINRQLEKYALEVNAEFSKIIVSLKESMVDKDDDW